MEYKQLNSNESSFSQHLYSQRLCVELTKKITCMCKLTNKKDFEQNPYISLADGTAAEMGSSCHGLVNTFSRALKTC